MTRGIGWGVAVALLAVGGVRAQTTPDYVVATETPDVVLGFDRARLSVSGTQVNAWIIGVSRDGPLGEEPWDHIVYWSIYDCDGWRARRVFAEVFDAEGTLLRSYPYEDEFLTFEEGSLGEVLIDAVCIGEEATAVTATSDRDFAARGRRYLDSGVFE